MERSVPVAHLQVYPVKQITCRTLVMHGPADGNVPLADAKFVARLVPKVTELFELEDCGHFFWSGLRTTSRRENEGLSPSTRGLTAPQTSQSDPS